MSKVRLDLIRAFGRVKSYLSQKFARSDEVRIQIPPHLKGHLKLCRVDADLSLNLMRPATREQDSGGSPE